MGVGVRERTSAGGGVALVAVLVALLLIVSVLPAQAAQSRQAPPIDPYAPYEPQGVCDPTPKPGVVAFAKLLLEAYPVSGWSGISRDCGVRGTSEHKEGRAFDWAVSVANPQQRAAAEDALGKLLSTDEDGNRHALFRRFGLMYVIWNRQIFSSTQPEAGWRPYACNSAASYDSCHVGHVHFSFSTAGAMMRSSWWEMTPTESKASIERVTSPTRATTAVEISSSAFPGKGAAEHVFLADAGDPHDAVVASVMAGAAHGAVLLTRGTDALEPKVDKELRRLLGASGSVTLVGDAGGLPGAVVGDHADRYQIRRVAGVDAFGTARAAALDMERSGQSRTAVVAGVDALDEALPMVAVAAANDWPIVFTGTDELSDDARGLLVEADIATVHIAGSTDAVSTEVRRAIADLDGVKVQRHGGDNVHKTSVTVARDFFAIPSAYALVNRDDLVTGAVAAAYAGERRHAPLLVTNGRRLGAAVSDYIIQTASPGTSGILVGDRSTLRRRIERELLRTLQ
jgi:putative cell wall-binding protein